jgi:hypothetical protein
MSLTLDHSTLCQIGAKFLKRSISQNGHGCHITIIEAACYGENPDVIGYRHGMETETVIGDRIYTSGYDIGTVVLEAKVSRGDFLRDTKKKHRNMPETGVGRWRYIICPEKLIQPDEVEPKWGLLWVTKAGHVKVISGALAIEKKTYIPYEGAKPRKLINRLELKANFEQYRFDHRNVQREMNILIMAMNRISDVEDIIYLQREKLRIETKLQTRIFDLQKELHDLKRNNRLSNAITQPGRFDQEHEMKAIPRSKPKKSP